MCKFYHDYSNRPIKFVDQICLGLWNILDIFLNALQLKQSWFDQRWNSTDNINQKV